MGSNGLMITSPIRFSANIIDAWCYVHDRYAILFNLVFFNYPSCLVINYDAYMTSLFLSFFFFFFNANLNLA